MLLFNRQNGVVKLEMNEKDAKDLAKVLRTSDVEQIPLKEQNPNHYAFAGDLVELLEEKDSPNSEEDALVNPKYFLNTQTGDAMVINWTRNAPSGEFWVEISEETWYIYLGNLNRKG